ncbi:MAG: glutathionylspermidine synthase family protein, partial [Bacillus sp. (in: firmicutes)]
MFQSTYHQNRKHFYEKMENFWPDLYGEEYALYDVYRANHEFVDQVRLASLRIGRIYFKIAKLLRNAEDDILVEMGFPRETLSFIRIVPLTSESVIARLDLVYTGGSIKCIEINADTPTFIKEVFSVNGMLCKEFGLGNPNTGMEMLLAKEVQASISAHLDTSKP